MWKYPDATHKALDILTRINIAYLVEQIRAGAQMLEVMDTNVSYLGPTEFRSFVLPCLERTVKEVRRRCEEEGLPSVPMTLFPKGANHSLELLSGIGYDVLSLDWCIDPRCA